MLFDPNNSVVKLCAQGINHEGEGQHEQALACYQQAWEQASSDSEKFTAAHYLARQQKTTADKLQWDQTALDFALKIKDETIRTSYPSLYLNIGKGYEDLQDMVEAKKNYELAGSFVQHLPDDGYGTLIKNGIQKGLDRVS